jgi:hypothetical protein
MFRLDQDMEATSPDSAISRRHPRPAAASPSLTRGMHRSTVGCQRGRIIMTIRVRVCLGSLRLAKVKVTVTDLASEPHCQPVASQWPPAVTVRATRRTRSPGPAGPGPAAVRVTVTDLSLLASEPHCQPVASQWPPAVTVRATRRSPGPGGPQPRPTGIQATPRPRRLRGSESACQWQTRPGRGSH